MEGPGEPNSSPSGPEHIPAGACPGCHLEPRARAHRFLVCGCPACSGDQRVKGFFTSETYTVRMRVSDRLVVGVTFDERRGGYIATAAGLVTVTALSLSSLRKRIEA